MKKTLPITLLAQIDGVAVFQTSAFSDMECSSIDTAGSEIYQHMYQSENQQQQASYGALN